MLGKFHIARMNTFHLCIRLHSDPRSSLNPACPCYKSPLPRWKFHIASLLHCSSPGNHLAHFAFFLYLCCSPVVLGWNPGGFRMESIVAGEEMAVDTFPAGLRVLTIDDDRVCLKVLERQLKYCNYNVTVVTDAQTALDMLRERKDGNQFDLVISDVYMPKMDSFKLLELIGLEMDLPVIMLSVNSETQTIMKGIKHGACDYMVKLVRLEQLRGLWTHVVKNSKTGDAARKLSSGDGDKVEKVGANHAKNSRKNKKAVDVADEDNENTSTQKKQRVQWCSKLHRKFVQAVNQIGMDRAVPKKIF